MSETWTWKHLTVTDYQGSFYLLADASEPYAPLKFFERYALNDLIAMFKAKMKPHDETWIC